MIINKINPGPRNPSLSDDRHKLKERAVATTPILGFLLAAP